jgi:hypothetical protein
MGCAINIFIRYKWNTMCVSQKQCIFVDNYQKVFTNITYQENYIKSG